jgi:type I restriction enzyme S subunit
MVPRRSVLFVVRGMSLATEWRIGMTSRDATLNQDLKAIVDDGTVVPELLLLWLLVHRETIRGSADEAGHGTKRLPTEVLHAHALAMPSRDQQERMAAPLVELLTRIEVNLEQSRTLAELRDTLLPKLISGEIRVPEAEAVVGAAV